MLQKIISIIRSGTFRTLSVFAGGNLLVAVLGGLGGLLQARWIAPEVFGEFRKFGILTSYFYVITIFVHDGLSRQFPYLLGKGCKDEALKVAAVAQWWYLFMAWLLSFVFVGLWLISMTRGDYRSAVGWSVQIVCIWTATYGLYLGVMYRTMSDFKRLSYNSSITGGIAFASLIFVKVWGYWGLALRSAIDGLASLVMNRHYVPVKVKATFEPRRLLALAKISLPLSIPGYIQTSCLGASVSILILKYCGQSALGIYGVAVTFQGLAMTFTMSLNQIFLTKLTSKFGETENVFACLKYARTPTLLGMGAAAVLAMGVSLAIGPFVRLVLPKYETAVPIIRILSLSLPLSAAALPLIILRSALWYKSVAVLALTRFGICLTAIALLPKTLEMIASSVMLGEICALLTGYGILVWNRRRMKAKWRMAKVCLL